MSCFPFSNWLGRVVDKNRLPSHQSNCSNFLFNTIFYWGRGGQKLSPFMLHLGPMIPEKGSLSIWYFDILMNFRIWKCTSALIQITPPHPHTYFTQNMTYSISYSFLDRISILDVFCWFQHMPSLDLSICLVLISAYA